MTEAIQMSEAMDRLATRRLQGVPVTPADLDLAILAGMKFREWFVAAQARAQDLEQGQGLLSFATGDRQAAAVANATTAAIAARDFQQPTKHQHHESIHE